MSVQANSLAIASEIKTICGNLPASMLTACKTTIGSGVQTVTPESINGISAGTQLQVDVLNPETITVTSVSGPSFTAPFTLPHTGPWTIGTPGCLYALSKLGEVQDPTDSVPFASVFGQRRATKRFDSGWKVNSTPIFAIESGADLGTQQAPIGSSVAEALILNIADILTGFFVAHIALGGVQGVYVTLVDADDTFSYKQFYNGRVYRIHRCFVKAVQQYNVLVGA